MAPRRGGSLGIAWAAWLLALCRPPRGAGELLCHSAGPGPRPPVREQCRLPPGEDGWNTCGWRVASYGASQWEVVGTLRGHSDAICALEWSPDGGSLVTGSADGTAKVWRDSNCTRGGRAGDHLADGAWCAAGVLEEGNRHVVRDVTWSPDGERLLASRADGNVAVWQAGNRSAAGDQAGNRSADGGDNGDGGGNLSYHTPPPFRIPPWEVVAMLQGHATGGVAWSVDWQPNGSGSSARIVLGARDRTGCVWRAETGAAGAAGPGARRALASIVACPGVAASDRAHGTIVQSSTYARSGTIWQAGDALDQWRLEASLQARHHVATAVRWSPDGRLLMTGGNDGYVRLWQARGDDVHGSGQLRWDVATSYRAHAQAVVVVAWSPDASRIVTGGRGGELRIWRTGPGGLGEAEWGLEAALDEILHLSSGSGGEAGTYNPTEFERFGTLNPRSTMQWVGPWSQASVAVWSPDGVSIATGHLDGAVRVWQTNLIHPGQWQVVATLKGHEDVVWSLDWSPDSMRLVSGGADGIARVWRLRGAAPAATLEAASQCKFARYAGHQCEGIEPAGRQGATPSETDLLRDFVGTAAECQVQCCAVGAACAGFVHVKGEFQEPGRAADAVGRCHFRVGTVEQPVPWTEDDRDCYKHARWSVSNAYSVEADAAAL